MTSWSTLTAAAPELAEKIGARFRAHRHHVLATVRADGSPRVSGTEVEILDGRLILGSMVGARKAEDLIRDPRCALHSNPGDGSMDGGDAKVAGRARVLVGEERARVISCYPAPPPEPAIFFEIEPTEAVLTSMVGPEGPMLIETWRPGSALRRFTRDGSETTATPVA